MGSDYEMLKSELLRLLNLITDARRAGNEGLAEVLTSEAAKCLIQLADAERAVRGSSDKP
jgi:hypothetical protein